MRAFLGVDLPEAVRERIAALQRELATSAADVKWVAPARLHVTLKFLDEISDAQRQAIEERVGPLAGREEAFRLGLERIGAFPSLNAPRVIWIGLAEGTERVAHLAQWIEQEVAALQVRKDERPFAAHLTIGRVRSARHRAALVQRLREASWQPPAAWPVTSLTLYHSVLSSSGPRYTVLSTFPLHGSR
jgi:2'-5' RNA ligase